MDRYTRLKITLYAVLWGVAFLLPLILQGYEVMAGYSRGFDLVKVSHGMLLASVFFVLFIINNFVLLPRLFVHGRKPLYFLAVIALLALIWIVLPGPHRPHPPGIEFRRPPINMFKVTNMIVGLCVVSANMAIKLYVDSMRREALLMQVRGEQMHSELEGLRYQLNPHFLMNTLNNIQALALTGDDRTVDAIQQMSLLMRYMLYETSAPQVPLGREASFLENFIALMKLRYASNVSVDFRFEAPSGINVPPLLFVSFVENAFKYGVSYKETSPIEISLVADEDHVNFRCSNRIFNTPGHGHGSGVGLENVRRRLKLIYGDDAVLWIERDNGFYKVNLDLPCSPGSET